MTKSTQSLILFLKAHVRAYTRRDGTMVEAHEDKRPAARAKAKEDNRTADMFEAERKPVQRGVPEVQGDLFSMPRDQAIKEHERLVDVLNSPSHEDDKREAKEQAEELGEMRGGGTRVRPDDDLRDGTIIRDADGKQYRVHYMRNSLIVAHPIVDGKPQVSSDTTVRFWTNHDRASSGENDRTDAVFVVNAPKAAEMKEGGTLSGDALAREVARQLHDGWSSAIGDTGNFVLNKWYPIQVTANGTTRKFAAHKSSGSGPLRLTTLVNTKFGEAFAMYHLGSKNELVSDGMKLLATMDQKAKDGNIADFNSLFDGASQQPRIMLPKVAAKKLTAVQQGELKAHNMIERALDRPELSEAEYIEQRPLLKKKEKIAQLRRDAKKLMEREHGRMEGIVAGQPTMSTRDRNKREKSFEGSRRASEMMRQADELEASLVGDSSGIRHSP